MTRHLHEIALSCRCGNLAGRLDLPSGKFLHLACYCRDCQAFARHLDADPPLLDEHGGTTVVATSWANLRIERGIDHLGGVRLTENGIARWFSRCCHTPVGNTLAAPRLPYVGIPTAFIADAPTAIGEVRWRLRGHAAIGTPPAGTHDGVPLAFLARVAAIMLPAWLGGDNARSPFFRADGQPRAKLSVLAPRSGQPGPRA